MHSNAKVHLDMTSNRVLSDVKGSLAYYNSWYSSDCFFPCILFILWLVRVWYIVGSPPGWGKPQTMKLLYVASLLST